ncbi:MAG: type II secretion system F family protein, partial [Acidimicrobiia bacterium]
AALRPRPVALSVPLSVPLRTWLDQAGATVAPAQFAAVSAGVALVAFVVVWGLSGAASVAVVPAVVTGALPRAWYARQRARILQQRQAAWPEALRDLVAHLEVPMSLHRSLTELGRSGPEPLRDTWRRYTTLTAALDARAALEAVREQLADPVSDRIFEVLLVAHEQGASVTLDALRDLATSTTADLRLAEQIQTAQLEQKIEARASIVLPFVVLVLLCSSSAPYREFYAAPGGWLIIAIGAAMSLAGTILIDRLGRLPVEERVFAGRGARR